jgi:hypothetical protein
MKEVGIEVYPHLHPINPITSTASSAYVLILTLGLKLLKLGQVRTIS